jgi:tetratricopeptide (TPR) repeat protein
MISLRRVVIALALAVMAAPVAADALDTIVDEAKALYANASYEAALKLLDAAPATADDADEYRALCLLALDRTDDAQHVLERLITHNPALVPSADEFPPRFLNLYSEVRERMLPTIVMDTLAQAREDFRTSKSTEAATRFQQVLTLSTEKSLADREEVQGAAAVAAAFLDLLKATNDASRPAALPPGPAATTATAPATSTTPPAAPEPQKPVTVPAVAVRQTVPRWSAASREAPDAMLQGAVRIVIGADGKVKMASIEASIDPRYDELLIDAAYNWRYTPATMNGKPVESERVVRVQVTP